MGSEARKWSPLAHGPAAALAAAAGGGGRQHPAGCAAWLAGAGVRLHNPEVLRWGGGVPPMFSFEDPDGNGLVYLEDEQPAAQ